MNNSWKIGQVKTFIADKGYGFIFCWDDRQDYFVHISGIEAETLTDDDFVIFTLEPSRKKPNTLEARKVCLLGEFKKDLPFLSDLFLKYREKEKRQNRIFLSGNNGLRNGNKLLRQLIIQTVPNAQVIELLELELSELRIIENERDYTRAAEVFTFYHQIDFNEPLKSQIADSIATWNAQNVTINYTVRLWLEKLSNVQPNDVLLEKYYEEAGLSERIEVFSRSNETFKNRVIEKLISQGEYLELIKYSIGHLKLVNGLGLRDIKDKLFKEGYWQERSGYDLYERIIRRVLEKADDKQRLHLFFEGYVNEVSLEYLLSNFTSLERRKLERILERGNLSQVDLYEVFTRILNHVIDLTPTPKSFDDLNLVVEPYSEEEFNRPVNLFNWVYDWAKKCLVDSEFSRFETWLINLKLGWIHIYYWDQGRILSTPLDKLSKFLLLTRNLNSKIEEWQKAGRISVEEVSDLLCKNLVDQQPITTREQYYTLANHFLALEGLGEDIAKIRTVIPDGNLVFFKLLLWIEGRSEDFSFEAFKTKLVFLDPEDQIKFLKKLFWLAHTEQFQLSIEKLDELTRIDFDIYKINERANPDIPLDISIDIVIETIKTFASRQSFLIGGEVLKLVLKNLSQHKKHRFKIEGLFEKCAGRHQPEFYWPRNNRKISKVTFGQANYYYAIEFESTTDLTDLVSQIPGSRWNQERQHWGVPKQNEGEVLTFGRENHFFFDFEGSNYTNNTHLAFFGRQDVPHGITYCEGRKANIIHRMFDREFWMCSNQACFMNCESIHEPDDWMNYTLLDFMLIMGFDLSETNTAGDYVDKGKYYKFTSTINWINLLSESLYCEECDHVLHPVEPSHFARHFVVRFRCDNAKCKEHKKEVYINQCLNGKRKGIVDSRRSKKCPNGMYICSDKNCGCCCSHKMFQDRLARLQIADDANTPFKIKIIADLKYKIDNRLGHLERAKHYCFSCGSLMKELPNDLYRCTTCKTQYDVAENRFIRPHRYL